MAYATDDSASDERTARPVTRERRSWCARCEGIGLPSSSRFMVGNEGCSGTPGHGHQQIPHAIISIPPQMRVARHFLISGRVQGVGFRYFTQAAAGREGLHGWVRNLPDGRVEVEAEGDADAIEHDRSNVCFVTARAAHALRRWKSKRACRMDAKPGSS